MPRPAAAAEKLRNTGVLFLTLMLFWVLLVGTLATQTLAVGALISLALRVPGIRFRSPVLLVYFLGQVFFFLLLGFVL